MFPQYKSISDLFHKKHLLDDRKTPFYLVEPELGEIAGIPTSHGIRVATNGIICLIELSDGSIFRGHNNWFIPEVDLSTPAGRISTPRGTTKTKPLPLFLQFNL